MSTQNTSEVFDLEKTGPNEDGCFFLPNPDSPEHYDFTLSLERGTPGWGSELDFGGFEDCPMLCYSRAEGDDWYGEAFGKIHLKEAWFYFRNREQWKAASSMARAILNQQPFHLRPNPARLLAYKDFDSEDLCYARRGFITERATV